MLGGDEIDSKILDEMLSKHFVLAESKHDSKVLGDKSPRAKNVKSNTKKQIKQGEKEVLVPQKTLANKQIKQLEKTIQVFAKEKDGLNELPDLAHFLQDLEKPKSARTKRAIQKEKDTIVTHTPKNAKNQPTQNIKIKDAQSKQEIRANTKTSSLEITRATISNEITESSALEITQEMSLEQIAEKIIEINEEQETSQNTPKGAQPRIARENLSSKDGKLESEQRATQSTLSVAKDSKQQGSGSSRQQNRDSQNTQSVARNDIQVSVQEDFANDLVESLEQGAEAMEEFELGKGKALNKATKTASATPNESKNIESKSSQQSTSNINASQKAQVSQRATLARESIKNFAQQIRDEVKNYKPPITRILLELHPQNLGTVELTISKRGKDLVLQVLSNQNAISLFSQNQAELRTNLNQMGFENIDMSFSTPQDSGGEQNAKQDSNPQNLAKDSQPSEDENQQGNKNSLNGIMEITIPRYA